MVGSQMVKGKRQFTAEGTEGKRIYIDNTYQKYVILRFSSCALHALCGK
jgi:hypothetical protein